MPGGAPITEFDHALQTEESRRLRLRFLWYCVISLIIKLVLMLPEFPELFSRHRDRLMARWSLPVELLGVAVTLWAIRYVVTRRPKRDALARLALALTIGVAGSSLLITRITIQHVMPDPESIFEQTRKPGTKPPTTAEIQGQEIAEASFRWFLQPVVAWAFSAVIAIGLSHLLASALIPWTLRESLVAGMSLIAVQTIILLFDVIFRSGPALILLILPASLLAVLPGLAICWWRQSRFRKQFRLNFEAKSFRELNDELQYARQVHESCLSPQVTTGPLRLHYVYEPMRQIGGDFLFAHQPPGSQQMWLVLLDVTGHGIAAALTVNRVMVQLQRQFLESPNISPAGVLHALNEYAVANLATLGLYATAICIRVDRSSRQLQWSSGGHPAALISRSDGRLEPLESTSMMLGVSAWSDGDAVMKEITFEEGDTVVCFTDGAIEAPDESGAMLKQEGIERMLTGIAREGTSPQHWPEQILRGVREHRQAPPNDDLLVAAIFAGK